MLKTAASPFKRGFFCDDQSLMHPYHPSTISSPVMISFSLAIPMISVCINKLLVHSAFVPAKDIVFGVYAWFVCQCFTVCQSRGNGLLSLSGCPILSSEMTSENAYGDAFQGNFGENG